MMKLEKRYVRTLVASVLFLVLTLALPLWRIAPLSESRPFIPLHYNVIFGIDRFGSWYSILWLPAIGFLSLWVNIIGATLSYHKEKLMSTLLFFGTLGVEFVLFCAMIFIVLVNL